VLEEGEAKKEGGFGSGRWRAEEEEGVGFGGGRDVVVGGGGGGGWARVEDWEVWARLCWLGRR
jgi:hypothetical protein